MRHEDEGRVAMGWLLFACFVILLIVLVVRAWHGDTVAAWAPPGVIAAMLLLLVRGGVLEFWKFKLSTEHKDRAVKEVREAAQARGETPSPKSEQVIRELRRPVRRSLLWVDDHPDNNVHESLALANLGFVIANTTSTETAMRFLETGGFDVVITDLGRGDNKEAGIDLLQRMRQLPKVPPAVVYTMGHDERHERARQEGARAVVVQPGELIQAVLTSVA